MAPWGFGRNISPGRNTNPRHLLEGLTLGGDTVTETTQGRQFPQGPGVAQRSVWGPGREVGDQVYLSESRRPEGGHSSPRCGRPGTTAEPRALA